LKLILLYDFFVNTLYRMKYENNIYFSNESDLTLPSDEEAYCSSLVFVDRTFFDIRRKAICIEEIFELSFVPLLFFFLISI